MKNLLIFILTLTLFTSCEFEEIRPTQEPLDPCFNTAGTIDPLPVGSYAALTSPWKGSFTYDGTTATFENAASLIIFDVVQGVEDFHMTNHDNGYRMYYTVTSYCEGLYLLDCHNIDRQIFLQKI